MTSKKNVEDNHPSLPHTPSDSDDEALIVNAVLFEEFQVPASQDAQELSKTRLRNESENITIGQTEDKLVYANSGGHGILAELEDLKRKIEMLISKDEKKTGQISEHERQISEHGKEISSLKLQVGNLMESSEGFLSIRRRFLAIYQRDVKGNETLQGSKAIREGNKKAHEGDALGDAMVFSRDARSDRILYRELYGLDYAQVLELGADDGGLFLVLNSHATMLAQKKIPSDDLKAAFNSFLIKVEEYWPNPPNKDPATPLGSAYYTFWKKFNEQA